MALTERAQQELEQIERQVAEMESAGTDEPTRRQIAKLQERIDTLRRDLNAPSTAWQKTELARHPQRPQTLDYIERVFRNFGTPHPEGYRKAIRVMKVAEKFRRPIFTLVDTDGAYPGIHAEERGQAEAIAHSLREMARLEVPIIATVIGVGGSGGALAIAVADRVLMMENSIYSVISPEGCAAIMWRDASKKELAAEAMRITATDLRDLACIDDIVPEPEGGAHRDHEAAANLLDVSLQRHYAELKKVPPADLVVSRYNKFRNLAAFFQIE